MKPLPPANAASSDASGALSVMTTFNHSGKQPITDITRIVYDAFALLARSNEWGAALRPPLAETASVPAGAASSRAQ